MRHKSQHEKKSRKSPGVMNIILVIVGIALVVFTTIMVTTFWRYGSIPDTLCTCVFACLGGECGIMGWIKTTKERNREREWQKEDEEAAKEAAEPPAE